MKIVISIPVHEKPEVINDQICNFLKYIDNSIIILHVSKGFFDKYSLKDIEKRSEVIINPTHLDTQWASIIQTHISNFQYISSIIDFDYFVLHASNDMYIKKGFDKYIQQYDAGFNIRKVIKKDSHWWPGNFALQDQQLRHIMSICGQSMVVASQVESSFYKKEFMEKIINILNKYYNSSLNESIYPREEIYFPTIASSLISWGQLGYTTTFSEVHRFDRVLWKIRTFTRKIYYNCRLNLFIPEKVYFHFEEMYNNILFKSNFYKTRVKTIKKLIDNNTKYIEKNSTLNDGSGEFRLYNKDIFSVKRIQRNIDDPVRKYISKSL